MDSSDYLKIGEIAHAMIDDSALDLLLFHFIQAPRYFLAQYDKCNRYFIQHVMFLSNDSALRDKT